MLRIDGYYLYELGYRIHGIADIEIFPNSTQPIHTCGQALSLLYPAIYALDELMTRSVYRLRTVDRAAIELREKIQWAIEHCRREGFDNEYPSTDLIYQLQVAHREFETVLKAELSAANIYLVVQKSAFDTITIIDNGYLAFPSDLVEKVPDIVEDLNQAMRCIAFEIPTAAAFHLHRANEMVLGVYWDSVSGGEKRPKSQTLGAYIGELTKHEYGSATVISALRDIKDLHRNPTIHADQTLGTVEEAIDLQGAVRAVMSAMLREIPAPETVAENGSNGG